MAKIVTNPCAKLPSCSLLITCLFLASCAGFNQPVIERSLQSRLIDKPVSGKASRTAGDILITFDSFLQKHNIRAGAIAVSYQGNLIADAGLNRTANDPAPVASLSKAITAVCTVKALESGNMPLTTMLGTLMPALFTQYRVVDKRFRRITVAQLLAQSSGIDTAHLSENSQSVPKFWDEQKLWQFSKISAVKLNTSPGEQYHYANANYLILGLVIEKLTGQTYERACQDLVLRPLGIGNAKLSSRWKLLSSYGGWSISAADYLKFVNAYFTPSAILGKRPDTYPARARINENSYYSLGVLTRFTAQGHIYWHGGSFTWHSPAQSGRFASFFVAYANGYTVSLNYALDDVDGRGAELDKAIYDAVHRSGFS